jgi:hypothetical protein
MRIPARPLSAGMKATTAFVLLVPVALLATALAQPSVSATLLGSSVVLAPVLAWAIRQSPLAYEVRGGTLTVHTRLGGAYAYRLDGTFRSPAPGLRLRLFGSSGFYGHTGWFLDAEGRRVRAFVSRAEDLVSIGTNRGPIVLSPQSPAELVGAVQAGTVR